MSNALIGFSGFVGTTLLRQQHFEFCYRSTNISDIEGHSFEQVVCAGAPAQKWLANQKPEEDRQTIDRLMGALEKVHCQRFILISTVDVFKHPIGVDESTPVDVSGLHPYGLHRRILEEFVESRFSNHLIVRLPGLVGPGLRKNVIFDFLNQNDLHRIDSRGIFQFYPTVNLWPDIQAALEAHLNLVHLTAEPMSVADVAKNGFGMAFVQEFEGRSAVYDMRTVHAKLFVASGDYQYTQRESLLAIRAYAQSEPKTLKA